MPTNPETDDGSGNVGCAAYLDRKGKMGAAFSEPADIHKTYENSRLKASSFRSRPRSASTESKR